MIGAPSGSASGGRRGGDHESRLVPALHHLRRRAARGQQGHVQALRKVRGQIPGGRAK